MNELYFYLTDTCNLACRHCWIELRYCSEEKAIAAIDRELFTTIPDQAEPLGTKGVKLTGGEPLLHPRIDELLDIIRQRRLRLTVETNGTLCTPSLAERIAVCQHAFAAVSLDAAEAEIHDWIRGAECVMKHICMGSCVAQNYYRHRDILAPYWYCEEANNRGLFPETRLRPGKLT